MNRVSRLGILTVVLMLLMAAALPASAATTRFSASDIACVVVDEGTAVVGDDGSVVVTGFTVDSYLASSEALIAGPSHRVANFRVDAAGNGRLNGYGTSYSDAVPGGYWTYTFTGTITGPRARVHVHAVGGGDFAGYSWVAKVLSGPDGCESGGSSTITGKLTT